MIIQELEHSTPTARVPKVFLASILSPQLHPPSQLLTAEKEELFGFAKATTLLSILKSKARRTLGVRPKKRTAS